MIADLQNLKNSRIEKFNRLRTLKSVHKASGIGIDVQAPLFSAGLFYKE
jgi:hypothetical protein